MTQSDTCCHPMFHEIITQTDTDHVLRTPSSLSDTEALHLPDNSRRKKNLVPNLSLILPLQFWAVFDLMHDQCLLPDSHSALQGGQNLHSPQFAGATKC